MLTKIRTRLLNLGRQRSFSSAASLTHDDVRTTLRSIIEKEINPYVDEWETEGIFPAHQVFKILGDNGLLGLTKPEENGGLGLDWSYALVMAEELGNINCGGVPMAIGVQTDMATPALGRFGSDEVRDQFLTPSIKGDFVACLGVSEVGGGSDVASLKTTAKKDGDDYIINGSKMWTTSGTQADWMCLLANTDDDNGPHFNKTLMCLPMDLPGITLAPRFDKLGMRSSDTTQVHFDNVRIPQSYRIGKEGDGFKYQMIQFQEERLWAAAGVLLPMEKCINDTAEYCRERKSFGKPLLSKQVIQHRLCELQTEVELLRSLVYRATDELVKGKDVTELASMAKLKSGRLVREVTDGCLQYWGGMGFMNETFVSRAYRDFRVTSIGGGADEVMLEILAKIKGYQKK